MGVENCPDDVIPTLVILFPRLVILFPRVGILITKGGRKIGTDMLLLKSILSCYSSFASAQLVRL